VYAGGAGRYGRIDAPSPSSAGDFEGPRIDGL